MAQKHNADYTEKPMTVYGRTQGPSRRYRRLRHPTFPAAEWTAKNPLLQRGEIGIESDTHKAKCGDGTTYWNDLPYSFITERLWGTITGDINNQTDLVNLVDDKVATEAGLRVDADDALQGQITVNKGTMDDHIADTNNPHNVTATQVGLGNCDNTSDLDKPISTATQTALNTKADKTNLVNGAPLSTAKAYYYGTSDTAAATVEKAVAISNITELNAGQMIIVQPSVTSTVASSTLKLNNFPAYEMRYNGAAVSTSTDSVVWNAGYPSFWVFDGSYWVFAGHGLDSNTTYTLNYSLDAGKYIAGSGTYAVTRYSILAQKPNGTWEKLTATNATYSTGTTKSVNTSGFILNQLRYYGTTTTVANGAKIATNTLYEKAASVDMRYSTNCGGTTTWAEGDYIYLVGTIGVDGLFYLDTTTWWTNALPTTNDGKLYIRLGLALAAAGATISFFADRPVFYHDGTKLCEYKVADNKQDKSASAYNMGNASGGWTAMSTAQQNALNSGATTTNIGQIATNTSNIADEIIDRQNADNGLQTQIDALVAKSDVVDIVGTYADLQAYDTTDLGNNDVIKVLSDSTHNDAPSYYRWVITGGVGSWVYVGSEAETYTKAEVNTLLNAKQDTISATDGITLTGTTLTNSGVRSVASGTANGTISVNTNGTTADVAVTGLGSAAYTASSAYATSTQGGKADTAVQPGDLATVATTGSYNDLLNTPTIPAAQVNSDWNANSGVAEILNKPTIPTVNNSTITITQGGVTKGTFTLNQASGDTIALDAGGGSSLPSQTGHSGEFLTTDGTDASWAAVDALPSQTGQSGKFLTTDGTDASWSDKPLVNTATGGSSLTISGTATNSFFATNIGFNSSVTQNQGVAVGYNAKATSGVVIGRYAQDTTSSPNSNIVIGNYATANSSAQNGIAIGTEAKVSAKGAIQIGGVSKTNTDANTFKVANANGNFEIMSADGTIPEARLADTTGASQGDVLTLDSNGDAVWQAAGGGSVSIDNSTITKNGSDQLQAVATVNANSAAGATNPIYDWVGTLAEHTSQAIATTHPDWICYITDDQTADAYQAYTKAQADSAFVAKGHELVDFQEPTVLNDHTWYRLYSDGWVEQGGVYLAPSGTSSITLPVEMAGGAGTYTAQTTAMVTSSNARIVQTLDSSTSTTLKIITNNGFNVFWEVRGMAA